ncbi:hypothetical protein DLREEDagrD3_22810 [Denitratisoma sp. agr-D3]
MGVDLNLVEQAPGNLVKSANSKMTEKNRGRDFPASKGGGGGNDSFARTVYVPGTSDALRRQRARRSLLIVPNLLDRDFTSADPNQVWTANLTHILTAEGLLCLVAVLDLLNRKVIGWSLKPRMMADIVIDADALTMTWFRCKPIAGQMQHSGRGCQYVNHLFQARLKEYGVACSMNHKGNRIGLCAHRVLFNRSKNERVRGTHYEAKMKPLPTSDYI